jgi:hypothetical protein
MNDDEKIDALEKRIDLLNAELKKSNIIGNKNLPIIVKSFFVLIFFLIMGVLRPDLEIKIIEMIINSMTKTLAVTQQ